MIRVEKDGTQVALLDPRDLAIHWIQDDFLADNLEEPGIDGLPDRSGRVHQCGTQRFGPLLIEHIRELGYRVEPEEKTSDAEGMVGEGESGGG